MSLCQCGHPQSLHRHDEQQNTELECTMESCACIAYRAQKPDVDVVVLNTTTTCSCGHERGLHRTLLAECVVLSCWCLVFREQRWCVCGHPDHHHVDRQRRGGCDGPCLQENCTCVQFDTGEEEEPEVPA